MSEKTELIERLIALGQWATKRGNADAQAAFIAAESLLERDGCPCVNGAPCNDRCTCLIPTSSFGCRHCARYGSKEQREGAARHIAASLSQPKPLAGIPFLRAWMTTPNPMLGNVSPLEMMQLGRGDKLAVFIKEAFAPETTNEWKQWSQYLQYGSTRFDK